MSSVPRKTNPFPGLRPFTQEEDYLFFGREEQTMELLQRLSGNRFLAVVGMSGSGKSSLVRCGLLSELLGGKMLHAGAAWEIAVTHPGGNPLALLAEAILDADLYDGQQEHARENLLATLSRSHFGLVEAVKQANLGEDTNFLLVVDQFEEIFRFHEAGQMQQEAANEFVSILLAAVAQTEVPIYVVLTMRSDFIGECGQFEDLAETVNRGEFLIPRLNREQYKRVIEGPVKVAGGQIAPRLVQRLLNDLGQQADQLPCLQHALMRTWNVWRDKGDAEALDLDDYQRVGKMTKALSLHADEVYDALPSDRQRELCRGMFQALTVQELESRGIRRPQRLGSLCNILEVTAAELLPIIDAYRQSGVTFLMPSPDVELTDKTIIDISHESLMRVWTRLRRWVDEEAQAAGIYRRLSESATLYEQEKAGLYRDPELGIALAWREEDHPNEAWAERYRPGFAGAMAYLDASQQASVAEAEAEEAARERELEQSKALADARQVQLEQQQRSTRKLRKLVALAAAVAIIAVIASIVAIFANNKARDLAVLANEEAENARQNEAEATAAREASRRNLYATDMQLAPFIWADDESTVEQFRSRLDAHDPEKHPELEGEPDLRGFEWYYLQHLIDSGSTVFAAGDASADNTASAANTVLDTTLTPDGDLITLAWPAGLKTFDPESRIETHSIDLQALFAGQTPQIGVLSPDGTLTALAIGDKVYVVTTSDGKEVCQVDSVEVRDRQLIFSSDNQWLVVGDDQIKWFDVSDGRTIAVEETGIRRRLSGLSLSDDGLTLAIGGMGKPNSGAFTILELVLDTQEIRRTSQPTVNQQVQCVAVSGDGKLVAVGTREDGNVLVCNVPRLNTAARKLAHSSPITAVEFGPGNTLVTAAADGTIKTWQDAKNPVQPTTLKGHEQPVTQVLFSQDGKQILSTSQDSTARLWDLSSRNASVKTLPNTTSGIKGKWGEFSPDGLLIAGGTQWYRNVGLFDASTGQLVRMLPESGYPKLGVAFSPDNRTLALGHGNEKTLSHVSLWDIDTAQRIAFLPGGINLPDNDAAFSASVGALAFSRDGRYLVAGFGGKDIAINPAAKILKVWDMQSRREIARLHGQTNQCSAVAFSDDGKWIASANYDGSARVWGTDNWELKQTFRKSDADRRKNQTITEVAFSPDGETLAVANMNASLDLWNVQSGTHLQTLQGHSHAIEAVLFSRPHGNTLVSGSRDGTARLWNVATGRELMRLNSDRVRLGTVATLAFSRDGKQLLTVGEECAAWSAGNSVWDDPDEAAKTLGGYLDANVDFQSRIRMLSENPRLLVALERLQQQQPEDVRVQAALAATKANWFAMRNQNDLAAAEFERLVELSPNAPDAWLRTTGLLRLATMLVDRGRYAAATRLLAGGSSRRVADGLKVADSITGSLTAALVKRVDDERKKQKNNAEIIELRGELAGQLFKPWEKAPLYTAAIELVSQQGTDTSSADLQRLYQKRADAYLVLEQWQLALDDYARLNVEQGGVLWLADQALAQASILLLKPTVDWTPLEPIETVSTGGAKLTPQEDGSILASGKNPNPDSYRLVMESSKTSVSAIRLEALRYDSSKRGPGRGYSGNFHMLWTVNYRDKSAQAEAIRLPLTDATADYFYHKDPINVEEWFALDGGGESHYAVYNVHGATESPAGLEFTITMDFPRHSSDPGRNLGRFRISISDDPEAFLKEQQRIEAMKISDPRARLAAAYYLDGDQEGYDSLIEQHPTAISGIADLHASQEQWEQALAMYAQALAAAPDDPALLAKRAEASVISQVGTPKRN